MRDAKKESDRCAHSSVVLKSLSGKDRCLGDRRVWDMVGKNGSGVMLV